MSDASGKQTRSKEGGVRWGLIEFPELRSQASHDCTANAVRVEVMWGIKERSVLCDKRKQKGVAVAVQSEALWMIDNY